MKIKEQAKYVDREWGAMDARLVAFLENGDQEDLHKFRVQIKKLRAMLSLFGHASKENTLLKYFKPVRKIFREAGDIRNAHVNLELSHRYQLKNEQFELGQQQIITEGGEAFRSKGQAFLKAIKTARKQLIKQLKKIDDSRIAAYYKTQLEQIAANLTVSVFNEDMHTNRKLIKILVYNHKLAEKALTGSLQFNIDYLDKLQEAIGKWHDNLLAEQLFSSPELNDKAIVGKIKRLNAKVKRGITTLTEDFLTKATTVEPALNI